MIPQRLRAAIATPWRRTLYIMFAAQLLTAVGFSIFVPFLPLYIEDLGSTTGLSIELLAGLAYSGQALTMMLISPVWGSLADRVGRKLMVVRAMFGGALVLILLAFVTSGEQVVIVRAIQGLITGTVAAANALVAAEAPRERVGYAMGLLQMGLFVGISVGPLLGGGMADVFGYHAVFYITSGLLALGGLLVLFGVREHAERQESRDDPSREGFLTKWRRVLATPGVKIAYLMRFMAQLGRTSILPYAPLFVASLMPPDALVNSMTGLVIGSVMVTTSISGVFLGRLSDRIGQRKIVVVATLAAGLLYIPQSLVGAAWQLVALQAIVGVALGGVIPLISAMLANYTTIGEEGSVYGLDNSINSGARVVAPMLGSAVVTLFGLRAVFISTALVFTIAGWMALRYLPETHRPKGAHEQPTG
ncbi:MAG: MFS transporter [Candidatus Bipolaricaulia bacterium]